MIRIQKGILPRKKQDIYDILHSYFLDHDVDLIESDKNHWLISLSKKKFDHCDNIKEGLDWLNLSESNCSDFYLQGDNYLFCLAESFIPYGWSCLYSKENIDNTDTVLLHLDSHRDLMNTRLSQSEIGVWNDLLTNKEVKFSDPLSVLGAVRSGAIGIGSMVTPLLHHNSNINIAHYNPSVYESALYHVKPSLLHDNSLGSYEYLLCSAFTNPTKENQGNYIESNSLDEVVNFSKDKKNILLHIDMDSLNNRYNGDSDWEAGGGYYDNDIFSQISDIDKLVRLIMEHGLTTKIKHVSIGISPSFYPVEFWKPVTQYLLCALIKSGIDLRVLYNSLYDKFPCDGSKLDVPDDITIEKTSCNTSKKQCWSIHHRGERAGKVIIESNDNRASINVQLNKSHQGLGIGKYAFHLACEASCHNIIEAVMRKSNIASMHSSIKAGFFELNSKERRSQRHMIWLRK